MELTLDLARKVSGAVSPEGGALSVVGADGTSYELSVPAGAVLSDVTLGMTPVASIDGVVLGEGPMLSVHLEPEGLEFLEPVTLTIRPAADFADKSVVAFNSHGTGQEFYLQPHTLEDDAVVLSLQHFSNPGAALIEPASFQSGVAQIVPSDERDQFEHELGLDIRREAKQAEALTRRYYGSVRSKLEAAKSDPTQLKAAIRAFLTLRKEIARLDMDQVFTREIFESWTLIAEGIDTALVRLNASCSVNSTFSDFVDMLGWIQWIKRNPRLAPYFEGKLGTYEALAQGCASFELEFDYTLSQRATQLNLSGDVGADVQGDVHFHTKLDVSYSFEYSMLTGSAPMEVVSWTASGFSSKHTNLPADCPSVQPGDVNYYTPFSVGAGSNGKSAIPLVSLLIDADDPNAPAMQLQTLTLFIYPSATIETFSAACKDFDYVNVGGMGGYVPALNGMFYFLHDWHFTAEDPTWWRVPFTFERETAEYTVDHDYQGPDPVLERDDTTISVQGRTTVKLRHTPK